jgi:hypothetical protein
MGDAEYDGYVPDDLGIGGGDYVEINLCLECGQVAGNWPLPNSRIERMAQKLERQALLKSTADGMGPDRRAHMCGNPSHINKVTDTALDNPNGGAEPVLALILNEEDPKQIIACVVALFQYPELKAMAQVILDKFSCWEHWPDLKAAVAPYLDPDDLEDDDF